MYDKSTGYNNEYNFVKLLNNKKVKELDPYSREMMYKLFYDVDSEDIIKCWKNHLLQKGDIFVKVRNRVATISIKMGAKNSLHVEHVHFFVEFLKENKIPLKIIRNYLEYHYGDGTLSGTGSYRISAQDYKVDNQYKIDEINKYISNEDFVIKAIDRFILKGNNCDYRVTGLIYGTPENYMFLTSNQIIKLLLDNKDQYSTGVHISSLFIQPQARNLVYNPKFEKERHKIQVKWFNIFDDLMKQEMKKEDNIHY